MNVTTLVAFVLTHIFREASILVLRLGEYVTFAARMYILVSVVGELPDTMCIWLQLKPVTYQLCQLLINMSTLLLTKVTRPAAGPLL